ncbi:hypothetical protein EMN47_13800 [Prolixibacteraceae bacterium JC049]|nr:hypothetical protein [Prolixibacteraceae bacterium JC049]
MSKAILTSAYLPCVQYISKLVAYENIEIEQFEHFNKQSYRNRCMILGTNGVQTLNVPVVKARNRKVLTKDVKIAYDTPWQKQHWKSIISAYNSSPFFEYYADVLAPFFENKYDYLLEFNQEILQTIIEEIELEATVELTPDFIHEYPAEVTDYRQVIHPKTQRQQPDNRFEAKSYTQVFSHKMEFQPNLSIIDLLFNKGPETYSFLEECVLEG